MGDDDLGDVVVWIGEDTEVGGAGFAEELVCPAELAECYEEVSQGFPILKMRMMATRQLSL